MFYNIGHKLERVTTNKCCNLIVGNSNDKAKSLITLATGKHELISFTQSRKK